MNERITLISVFNKINLEKINFALKNVKEPLCKVPYGKNIQSRLEVDTLPYHFTFSAWNISEIEFIKKELEHITFKKFKICVDTIEIMNGAENSYVLYFNMKGNDSLQELQKRIYKILPVEKYNPDFFHFHITICIDKDYERIMLIKNEIEKVFEPFELDVDCIGLYEIYPAQRIKKILADAD